MTTSQSHSAAAPYDRLGHGYALKRRPDPRIAAHVEEALGDARSVLNVGAGSGSYESPDREILAVEPSRVMIAQRPAGAAAAIRADAEALPLPDRSFDAVTAILTVHHWRDWRAGIAELVRVAANRVVVLAADAVRACDFWLVRDYLPGLAAVHQRFPPLAAQVGALGAPREVAGEIPHDCSDGFLGAYWRRPHAYLDSGVRAATSVFARLDAEALDHGLRLLEDDLSSGRWERRNGELLERESLDLGYRLLMEEQAG